MKASLILAAAGVAVAQNLSGEPSCAISCLKSAITAAGCAPTDVACQCGPSMAAISAKAAPCVITACPASDLLIAASVGTKLCSEWRATATMTGAMSSGSGSKTASSSMPMSTTSMMMSSGTGSSSMAKTTEMTNTMTSGSGTGAMTMTMTTTAAMGGSSSAAAASTTASAAAAENRVAGAVGVMAALLGAVAAL